MLINGKSMNALGHFPARSVLFNSYMVTPINMVTYIKAFLRQELSHSLPKASVFSIVRSPRHPLFL